MTHQYSIEIHDYVSDKIKWSNEMKKQAAEGKDQILARYYEGQLKEWMKMREYMDQKIDLKTQKYY